MGGEGGRGYSGVKATEMIERRLTPKPRNLPWGFGEVFFRFFSLWEWLITSREKSNERAYCMQWVGHAMPSGWFIRHVVSFSTEKARFIIVLCHRQPNNNIFLLTVSKRFSNRREVRTTACTQNTWPTTLIRNLVLSNTTAVSSLSTEGENLEEQIGRE